MSEIHVKEGESLDSALKRFKRSCAKAGIVAEVRRRESAMKAPVSSAARSPRLPARTVISVTINVKKPPPDRVAVFCNKRKANLSAAWQQKGTVPALPLTQQFPGDVCHLRQHEEALPDPHVLRCGGFGPQGTGIVKQHIVVVVSRTVVEVPGA